MTVYFVCVTWILYVKDVYTYRGPSIEVEKVRPSDVRSEKSVR
jgi:hypothetical protein